MFIRCAVGLGKTSSRNGIVRDNYGGEQKGKGVEIAHERRRIRIRDWNSFNLKTAGVYCSHWVPLHPYENIHVHMNLLGH